MDHPLGLERHALQHAYDQQVDQAVSQGVERHGTPTELEWVAARIAHLPGVPRDLVEGLSQAIGTGSPQRAQEIERARSDVLDQLSKVDD